MADLERWSLEHDGRTHVVEVAPSGWGRRLVWTRDGELLAETATSEEKVLMAPRPGTPEDAGALALRFGWWGPARRVTLFEASGDLDASARALIGVGGVDLRPEPGTPAARRQAWILAHPRLHTARRTLTAVAVVVVPIVLASLLARFAFSLPRPDWNLPRIPWPQIPWPQIPWPTIPWPQIPWPQIPWPDVSLPWWVEEALSYAQYVVPVAIAFVLARREIRRHRASQPPPGAGRPAARSSRQGPAPHTPPRPPSAPRPPTRPRPRDAPRSARPGCHRCSP